jgi:maltooligosyltrehalose trehalohydrolase
MPFGTELTEGGVRFRLWAPGASAVDVVLDDGRLDDARLDAGRLGRALAEGEARSAPLADMGAGWFEGVADGAGVGTRYRFRIDGERLVPDPASRRQASGVHGPSVVVDPDAYRWVHDGWRGRPWREAVLYELHVGTFSPEGSFDGVRRRLDHLVDLGVTAIQLMPIAEFPGRRSWGYDGVLWYAPAAAYGTPEDLKRLVDDAHGHGLMVFLDVIYNHFGPEGNYLHAYARPFFTERFTTPWGAAIDFARRDVRDFVIHNARHWLEEYRFDGLRLDAVDTIVDEGPLHILEELADAVRGACGDERHVHLVLENADNDAHYLQRTAAGRPRYYDAQWNDDAHHAFHVLATGERGGYYVDYADRPIERLGRALTEGFAFQGEPFRHHGGEPRGTPSAHLPLTAFVSFLQNHDQVGNRALGERLAALADRRVLEALSALWLLAPSPPLLFMGEEWGATTPFLFFCDFEGALADAVRDGRRREFASFPAFLDESGRQAIPDPNGEEAFERSRLAWDERGHDANASWLARFRQLLDLRRREIVPRLAGPGPRAEDLRRFGDGGLAVTWRLAEGARLRVIANLTAEPSRDAPGAPAGRLLHASDDDVVEGLRTGTLPPWSVAWFLD